MSKMKEYDVTVDLVVRVMADNPQHAAMTAINKVRDEMDNDTVDVIDVEEVKISKYSVEVGGNIEVHAKSCKEAREIVGQSMKELGIQEIEPTGNVDEI